MTRQTKMWMWPWAAAAVVAVAVSAMPVVDANEAQAFSDEQASTLRELKAERRLAMARQDLCNRVHGPQTVAAEDADGNFVCVGKRGQRHGKPTTDVKVASK